jgi:hypothetical protein
LLEVKEMYNTDLPARADLPTAAQLRRSTWIALASALAILGFVVLPAEYAVDPTGVGGVLGLTQMGEIKVQLAAEAAADAAGSGGAAEGLAELNARLDRIEAALVAVTAPTPSAPPAQASIDELISQPAVIEESLADRFEAAVPVEPPPPAAAEWRDEVSFTLAPGEGTEIKLVMEEGASAEFYWSANGAVVNYDTHGDGGGQSVSYEQGRGVPEQDGVLVAEFTGNHGWFWRNRTEADVTMTLRTRGAYSEMKRAQ